ncbi:MAG: glycosyl hydrolase, partial [Burkholderiaceae bacterium]|nr:glycosyl hydrolase [Burkholderiaceae bacterium]
NDGLQWKRAAARGLSGELNSLAVHPNDANVVAAGTERGLYLSRDAGETFERLVGDVRVFAETFDLDGEQLWFSTYAGQAGLSRVAFKPGSAAETVPIPSLGEDAVAYIAQNPVHRDEFSIATFKRSVFVSEDRGRSWTQIARDGATLP